jgi:hypothetical protein
MYECIMSTLPAANFLQLRDFAGKRNPRDLAKSSENPHGRFCLFLLRAAKNRFTPLRPPWESQEGVPMLPRASGTLGFVHLVFQLAFGAPPRRSNAAAPKSPPAPAIAIGKSPGPSPTSRTPTNSNPPHLFEALARFHRTDHTRAKLAEFVAASEARAAAKLYIREIRGSYFPFSVKPRNRSWEAELQADCGIPSCTFSVLRADDASRIKPASCVYRPEPTAISRVKCVRRGSNECRPPRAITGRKGRPAGAGAGRFFSDPCAGVVSGKYPVAGGCRSLADAGAVTVE